MQPIHTDESVSSISIFISHSSKDVKVAEALIDLLRAALSIPADKIRCTSVDGYRLQAGASTDEQLRREIYEARAFIGLITPSSLQSAYVLFELGARWGARLHLAPVLAAGMESGALRGPLIGLNALSCDVPAQVHQLVSDIAASLKLNIGNPSAYQKHMDALLDQSRRHREQPQSNPPADQPVLVNYSEAEKGEIQRLAKMVSKLESTLDIMHKALGFVEKLRDEDLTSKSGNLSAINSFRDMPYALRAFLACDGDEDKLRGYVRELVETISHNVKGGIGVDLHFYIGMGHYHSPLMDFNPEADRVFKEVDAQMGVMCRILGLKFPGGGSGRYGGQRALTSEQWFRRDLIAAANILNAAKTILE